MTLRTSLVASTALCALACTPDAPLDGTTDTSVGGGCGGLGVCALLPVDANPLAVAVEVQLTAGGTAHVEIDGVQAADPVTLDPGQPAVIDVVGLVPDVSVEVRLVTDLGAGPTWTWTPDPWPEQGPTAVVEGTPPDDDAWVCTNATVGDGAGLDKLYWCSDLQGTPRWVTRHPDDLIPLVAEPLDDGGYAMTGRPDRVGLVDAAGRWGAQWSAADLSGATLPHDSFDAHEVVALRDGAFAGGLATLTRTEEVVGAETIGGHGIVVLDPADGAVLWEWSSHGAPGDGQSVDPALLPYARRGLASVPAEDWLHANALVHVIDDEGEALIASFRSQDWLVRIDLPSGDIVWRMGLDGDFALVADLDAGSPTPLSDEGWFFHQHAPEIEVLPDGRWRMLLVDNGNVRADDPDLPRQPPPYSRLLELEVDLAARRVAPRTLWGSSDDRSDEHWYAWAQGDLDRLPDGSLLWLDGMAPRVSGLSGDGGVPVWSLSYPDTASSYRAQWRQLPGVR